MPKMKTSRIVKKKFRLNAAGKVKRGHAYHSHNTAKKTPKQKRNLKGREYLTGPDAVVIKKLLPYG